MELLRDSDRNDDVVIYVAAPRAIKKLGKNYSVHADSALLAQIATFLGEKNVKLVEKSIEKRAQ